MKKNILIMFLLLMALLSNAQSMEMEVTGTATFDQNSFAIIEAGNDFSSSIEIDSDLLLTIKSGDEWDERNNPNRKWKIEVRREDISWSDAINLEIVRSGNGYWKNNKGNSGHINNGTNFQSVGNNSSYFFGGKGLISDIPIQLRLSGFSIVNGANDYETNVILTIYDD